MSKRRNKRAAAKPTAQRDVQIIEASSLGPAPIRYAYQTGSKFEGGFGDTLVLHVDYWTLRARSIQLFETNLYARGIVRRFITNEINTGLHLEASPEEAILGLPEDGLADWSEAVENRFRIWEKDPYLCDHLERSTFGSLQAQARAAALVEGDVLVVLRQDPRTQLPRVQLIGGSAVRTPINVSPQRGNRIVHGVELDASDRQVAYWVTQRDGTSKRLPVWGEKSGRRIAWLVYGTDKRLDEVRGKPILSLVLQSLREIDRYRDSVQRKAVINSMLALFIKKTEKEIGGRPMSNGAKRLGAATDQVVVGEKRSFNAAELIPGLVLDELQYGEEPQGFSSNGTDEKFGDFEASIVYAIAWALELPPEILTLTFRNNYSASQAAINEFKMYLNRSRTAFGEEFCQHIYVEWLTAEVIAGRVRADGLSEAWRDPLQYDRFGAWTSADWAGHIKPAVDLTKIVRAYDEMIAQGLITRDRACREVTGMKFSKVVKQLRRENEALAHANAPLVELEALAKPQPNPASAPNAPTQPEKKKADVEESETIACPSCGDDLEMAELVGERAA
jgi:lambda family phage portal protein